MAQSMIDSLLYAKLPSKCKQSVEMARLEFSSAKSKKKFDESVAHLEQELEPNALEESDDLPMATMTSSTSKSKNLLSNELLFDIDCNYCKENGYMVKDCKKIEGKRKRSSKEQTNSDENLP